MKKSPLIIGTTTLIILVMGWQMNTYSQLALPKPKPSSCQDSVQNEIFLMRNAWNTNLQAILNQEKPTSEKVDESFESLRTYQCWLNYLCEAVIFSGNANEKDIKAGAKLNNTHLDNLVGCVGANEVEIPGTQLKMMPLCQVPINSSNRFNEISTNSNGCRQLVAIEFAGSGNNNPQSSSEAQKTKEQSGAFASLERALKTDSGNQKGRIIGDKLRSILIKMHGMEAHIIFLREQLEKFDSRLPCYIDKCD